MKEPTIGEKIHSFRKRAGKSQMELETEVGASTGSISRIEKGNVNPTKETIVDIAKALELSTSEIAYLFGINLLDVKSLVETLTSIHTAPSLNETLDKIVNDLVFKLGYLASVVFLREEDKVFSKALTNSNISAAVFKLLDKPFTSLFIPYDFDESLTIQAIKQNRILSTKLTRDYVVPCVPASVADMMQQATGDRSHLIVPLSENNTAFGIIVFIKKVDSDFSEEQDLLESIAQQLSSAIAKFL